MNTRIKDIFQFSKQRDLRTNDRRLALQRQHKCLERTHSNPVPNDHRPKKCEFRRTSSEGNRITVPTISITGPRFESCTDSESSSSRFGVLDDDVFCCAINTKDRSANYLEKNLLNTTLLKETFNNQQSELQHINNQTTSPLESHDMRRLLKIKIEKCIICEQAVYFWGIQCLKCGLVGHRKCMRCLVIRCPPKGSLPTKVPLFGINLDECVGVPQVMHTCISELERRPFSKLKGIYRSNGNSSRVAQICASFQCGPQLIDLRYSSYNDITDVLKIYLNKLPKPLVPPELQLELIRIAKEWPQRKVPYTKSGVIIIIFELREVVNQLPSNHFIVLSYLMHHLKRLTLHKREVEINESTLAVQFISVGVVKHRHDVYFGTEDPVDGVNDHKRYRSVWSAAERQIAIVGKI
ncbi:rho GTPase-activating protein 45-like [Oppia nitens]|uniref:rho GTPase-activating protein 45-like n=1 Tax=Oppia nitens TaxID=1686743 RepID=UPI0023DB8C12|nr:rho GTPase-activating protein 45-like [Oppia nitens]